MLLQIHLCCFDMSCVVGKKCRKSDNKKMIFEGPWNNPFLILLLRLLQHNLLRIFLLIWSNPIVCSSKGVVYSLVRFFFFCIFPHSKWFVESYNCLYFLTLWRFLFPFSFNRFSLKTCRFHLHHVCDVSCRILWDNVKK